MAITPAVELADFASGIGTAPLQIDNVNDRVGVGTTAPLALLDVASFERAGVTTALLVRHTASTLHAVRVEDETHPDVTPFIINSNGRVAIGTDATDGFELTVSRANPSIRLKATASGNSGRLLFSGRDSVGTAYTTELNSRNHAGLDIHLDIDGTNTNSDENNYRKLKLYPVGSAEASSNSEPGIVVAFGGTFRNGPDQVGISSVGIGTNTPLGRFHLETRTGNLDQNCFRIRNNNNIGTPGLLKIENLYDKDVGLVLRNASTNDGSIDDVDNRWFIYNDGSRSDAAQNSFRIASGGAITNKNLVLNTNGRAGFGTELPDNPIHVYKNDAILACFERQGVANAGIEFKKSTSGNGARQRLFLGLSADNNFGINDAEDLDASPFFQINRTGIASAFAFTSTNDNQNLTDGRCAINLTGQTGAIAMDTDGGVIGTKRISWNDGTGNFNIRLNATGDADYLVTNDGACHIALNGESADGTITVACAPQGTAGNSISYTSHVFGTDGLTISGCGRLRDNTGQYGSIEITGGNSNTYGGLSIEGAAVFMRNATNGVFGLYDDTNNHWAIQHTPNGATNLYHDNVAKVKTRSDGADIEGFLFTNNGSATTPSHSFDSDENTGMFKSGTDRLGLCRAGVEILRMDGTFQTRGTSNSGNILSSNKGSSNNAYTIRSYRQLASDFSGGTEVFRIKTNGNAQSLGGAMGSISDERLKENIQDAESQWDDVKALRLVNYYWKDHDIAFGGRPEDGKRLGWIAQEVQKVSPGLVDSSIEDYIVNDAHPGFTTTADDGTEEFVPEPAGEYLGLKDSIIHVKAFGALQEAMTRIEILEARINNAGIAST